MAGCLIRELGWCAFSWRTASDTFILRSTCLELYFSKALSTVCRGLGAGRRLEQVGQLRGFCNTGGERYLGSVYLSASITGPESRGGVQKIFRQ